MEVCYRVSKRRACEVLELAGSTCYYQSVADEQAELRIRLKDLAQARVSYGYRRLHIMLRREGWQVNHKRVYRLYREEGFGDEAKEAPAARHGLSPYGQTGGHRAQRGLVYGLHD